MTTAFNKPEFIEIQYRTLKKYLLDDFDYFVFNDAMTNSSYECLIKDICEKFKIHHIRYPQEFHTKYDKLFPNIHPAPIRQTDVIQYAFEKFFYNHDDILVIIDSDIFFTHEVSLRDRMTNYDVLALPFPSKISNEHKVISSCIFPSSMFMCLKVKILPKKEGIKFNTGYIGSAFIDSFGFLQFYFYLRDDVKINYLKIYPSCNLVSCSDEDLFCLDLQQQELIRRFKYLVIKYENIDVGIHRHLNFIDNFLIDYGRGSNWSNNSSDFIKDKDKIFYDYIGNILN